jgi:hypothetical protein
MSRRKGDWRDLLTTYALALKPNKIYVGYLAVLYTLFVLVVATFMASGEDGALSLLANAWAGGGRAMLHDVLPLLNPFYDGTKAHFLLSILTYVALFFAWSGAGGMISRLTALEYARDDLPTLADAREMVRSRRAAYFMAPVWPLLFFVALAVLCLLGGLVASIPYAGRILLFFPGFPLLAITGILMVLLVLFGFLSFGLMAPAISVGGKDALDGWSTSYTYVLWGSGRYICYTALAGVIGLVSLRVVGVLTHLLVSVVIGGVNLGYVASGPWVNFAGGHPNVDIIGPGGYYSVMQCVMGVLMLAVLLLPYAYGVSFFFSANTVIFFLLRKHVDNIEIEEIYEESEEEGEEFQPEQAAVPEPPSQPQGPDADEEIPPEVAEEGPPEPSGASGELPKEPDVEKDRSMED